MTMGLSLKAPPSGPWVSLTSALTWVAFQHAFETAELMAWIARQSKVSTEEIARQLSQEWQRLADVACDGSIPIRARERNGYNEVELRTDDLRNFRHVWFGNPDRPKLCLDRSEPSFDATFDRLAAGYRDGFDDPVVNRKALARFKRKWRHAPRAKWGPASYNEAEKWLDIQLTTMEPRTGLQSYFLEELGRRFKLPQYVAKPLWTEAARRHNWPLHGRPKTRKSENSRNF